MGREQERGIAGSASVGKSPLWPWLLAIALAAVVVINGIFLWIAVHGADPVAPSYSQGDR